MTLEEKLIHKRLRKLLVQSTPYTFRSYKPMCETLKLPIKEGNSRVCQIKWLQNLCNLEKIPNSRSYTFSTVYQDPDAHVLESNPIALAAADILLHSFIGQTEKPPTLTLDVLHLWKFLGFVNQDYGIKDEEDQFIKISGLDKIQFTNFKFRCKERITVLLNSTLNILSKRGLITYESVKLIFKIDINKQLYFEVAQSNELKRIQSYEQQALTNFKCTNIAQVWGRGHEVEYYHYFKNLIKKNESDNGWAFVSNGYKISCIDKTWYYSKGKKQIDVNNLKRVINEYTLKVLQENAKNKLNNYIDSTLLSESSETQTTATTRGQKILAASDKKQHIMSGDYLSRQKHLTDRFIRLLPDVSQ